MKRYTKIFDTQYDYGKALFDSAIHEYSTLQEKTFNIGKDVDFIYNVAFKKHVDIFQKKGIIPPAGIYEELHTGQLKSKTAQKANNLSPMPIICGMEFGPSHVSFVDMHEQIVINLNISAARAYPDKSQMYPNDQRAIENELAEHRVKSVIYHELSHWISNALHNTYLYTLVARALKISRDDPERNKKMKKIMSMGKLDATMTHYEIDAQIHAIKQIKRSFKKEWDNMTLVDLFYRNPSLRAIAQDLYGLGSDVYKTWVKDLVKRMNREGLLGKNMKHVPEYSMFESYEAEKILKV